ncbi:hypothetical protein [Microbacterium foliorum]|uniref:hypothetical protein n=1 Tax=Microbacterium foliorum TaxID=104336 RepID=UPI0009A01500|nr:hypothetical protein [Microbacterium foliorum]AQY01616.1 hypothetical protein B2G67_09150 [Microbacterium foliorum]
MTLPSNVSYGTVKGRFIRAVIDGPDANGDPDGILMDGLKVVFTPSVTMFKDASTVPPATIVIDPFITYTRSGGFLVGDDGFLGIRLPATDDDSLQPTGWTWQVTVSGLNFPTYSFSFALPSDDGTLANAVDLTTVVPVPSSPGQSLADWIVAVQAAQAAVVEAQASALAAGEAVEGVPGIAASAAQAAIAGAVVELVDPKVAEAAQSVADASAALSATVLAKDEAVVAQAAAIAAADAAMAVPAQVDTAMADQAGDPESEFGTVLETRLGVLVPPIAVDAVGDAITAADVMGVLVPPIAVDAVGDAITAADVPGRVATALAAQAGKVVQGTGMPETVVTATPGTLYVDTASTNGASVWRKATGTGNTGWVCVHGDTGWRNVAVLLDSLDWAAPTGNASLRLRRTANAVYFTARLIPARTLTPGVKIITAPAGFGAANGIPGHVAASAGSVTAPTLAFVRAFPTTADLLDYWTASGVTETVSISLAWATSAAWPATLPGTAA